MNGANQADARMNVVRTEIRMCGTRNNIAACQGIELRGKSIHKVIGGAKRDRTADLLHAMQALSQLSYGPIRPLSRWVRQNLLPGVAAY